MRCAGPAWPRRAVFGARALLLQKTLTKLLLRLFSSLCCAPTGVQSPSGPATPRYRRLTLPSRTRSTRSTCPSSAPPTRARKVRRRRCSTLRTRACRRHAPPPQLGNRTAPESHSQAVATHHRCPLLALFPPVPLCTLLYPRAMQRWLWTCRSATFCPPEPPPRAACRWCWTWSSGGWRPTACAAWCCARPACGRAWSTVPWAPWSPCPRCPR